MRKTVVALLLFAFGGFGCGGSSKSPTNPSSPNLTGTWSGPFAAGALGGTIRVTFNQAGNTLTGNWTLFRPSGDVDESGSLAGTISGNAVTVTLTITSCSQATGTFNGSVSGTSLPLSSGGFSSTNVNCRTGAVTITLQKQ